MSNDLYYRCTECPGYPTGHCEKCGNRAYIPVGFTKEHVAEVHDHLTEGAAMMLALRDERTQLKAWLKEALDRLARGNADTRALIASTGHLKDLLEESAELVRDYTVKLEARDRVLGQMGVRLGMLPDFLAALLHGAEITVRQEYQAEADARRN